MAGPKALAGLMAVPVNCEPARKANTHCNRKMADVRKLQDESCSKAGYSADEPGEQDCNGMCTLMLDQAANILAGSSKPFSAHSLRHALPIMQSRRW